MNAVTLSGALVAAAWVGAALTTEAGYSRRSLQDHDIVVDKELLVTAPEVLDSLLEDWKTGRLEGPPLRRPLSGEDQE